MEFEVITLDWKIIKDVEDIKNLSPDSGVYQIYGDSPIYGRDTLLYIGKASNFKNRVNGHISNIESFITRQPNINFRFAKVELNLLSIVEQILIVMHKPSFNSANIIEISSKAKQKGYYIQNHGKRGLLHLEVTNFYFFNQTNNQCI